jgi:hypothetical protein
MNEKYIELAKKLKALADGSKAAGEKHTAQLHLDKVMKKYNISAKELEEDRLLRIEFKVPRSKKTLFGAIAVSVTGINRWWGQHKKRSIFYGEVSKSEEAEIRAKFSFYSQVYDDQLDLFLKAFIHKNDIYPPDLDATHISDLSKEEQKQAMIIHQIAEGLKRSIFYKTLSNSK